jgi:hypothetical protein
MTPTGQSVDPPVTPVNEITYSHSDHLKVPASSQSGHLNVVNDHVVEKNFQASAKRTTVPLLKRNTTFITFFRNDLKYSYKVSQESFGVL